MSKESLESLNKIEEVLEYYNITTYWFKELDVIKKELTRLEAIDNSNSNEALECLYTIAFNTQFIAGMNFGNELRTIEQALLKAQEMENENAKYKRVLKIIKEKRIDMWHLVDLLDQTYEMYVAFCKGEKYADDYILTREEFDLVKETLKNE